MKKVLFLAYNVGLGDVISFSPLFLLAMENYSVDVVYTTGDPLPIGKLFFEKEIKGGLLRFLKKSEFSSAKSSEYDFTILADRRLFSLAMEMGKQAGCVIPIPLQKKRVGERLLYNCVFRPVLWLCGAHPKEILANSNERISKVVFEQFVHVAKIKASYSQFFERVRSRIEIKMSGQTPHMYSKSKKQLKGGTILVHLFRDLDYKRIDNNHLALAAKVICEEFPSHTVLVLTNPNNQWEKEAAEFFSKECNSNNLVAKLISPALPEICSLSLSASLYVGVDHGISHLASMFCPLSVVIYGGSKKLSLIHLLWPPQIDGEVKNLTSNLSLLMGKNRSALLLHPSENEYYNQSVKNSTLINAIMDNFKEAIMIAKNSKANSQVTGEVK